jgi:hypothetical protein
MHQRRHADLRRADQELGLIVHRQLAALDALAQGGFEPHALDPFMAG